MSCLPNTFRKQANTNHCLGLSIVVIVVIGVIGVIGVIIALPLIHFEEVLQSCCERSICRGHQHQESPNEPHDDNHGACSCAQFIKV